MHDLQPGIYTIQLADANSERRKAYTVELLGHDSKTIIGYPCYEGKNQQEFATLGVGYSIQNVRNGSYMFIDFKENSSELRPQVIASSFPAVFYVKLHESADRVYRILSNSEYGFSMNIEVGGLAPVFLSKQHSNTDVSQLWTLQHMCECEAAPLSPSAVQLAMHMVSNITIMPTTVKTVRGSVVSNTGDAFTAVFNIDRKQYVFVGTIGDGAHSPPFYSFTTVTLSYEHIGDLSGTYKFSVTVDSNLSISATKGGCGRKMHGSLASAVAPPATISNIEGTWFSA